MADLQNVTYGEQAFTIPTYDDTALANRVSANETAIADRYTKEQTDEKIAEGIATVDSEHFHPVTVLPDVADAKENHEYILIEYEQDGVTIKSKTFYLFYDGAYHEDRAAGVSLEGYATEQYVDDVTGDLADLTTTAKADLVSAVNEVKSTMEGEHVELTQAQYDALTPAEKNNGTVYFITDAEVATVVDQTYDATSPHAQSGTAVAEAISDASAIKAYTATIPTYGGSVSARRSGNVVYLVVSGIGSVQSIPVGNTAITLFTLPSGYRPVIRCVAAGGVNGTQNMTGALFYLVDPGGKISYHPYYANTSGYFSCAYITSDAMPS